MTVEELQEQLLQQKEENTKLQTENNVLKENNEKLLADNTRLTEYNNKLFMRITEPVIQDEKQQELTPQEKENNDINDIINLMKDRRI